MTSPGGKNPNNNSIGKLKVIIITMGGERQKILENIFTSSSYKPYFEKPVFTSGCPSRSIRSRSGLLSKAHDIGLIPSSEWDAIHSSLSLNEKLSNLLSDATNAPTIKESAYDQDGKQEQKVEEKKEQHYSEELWYKCRSLGRERSVLACIFAHMDAMKRCVEEGFDIILEDNVRPLKDGKLCYEYINKVKQEANNNSNKCDLLYYGWLGSVPNIEWVLTTYKQRYNDYTCKSTLPFPSINDVKDEEEVVGSTPIWGAYAYWVSSKGYHTVLQTLQNDIGSFLWKSKRMKTYKVKPIDKILPRRIVMQQHDTVTMDNSSINNNVWISKIPCFFRAPMLHSTIHPQWDMGFCQSTERQLELIVINNGCNNTAVSSSMDWEDLFLEKELLEVVRYRKKYGEWIRYNDIVDKQQDEK